jgi:hypothetical protein
MIFVRQNIRSYIYIYIYIYIYLSIINTHDIRYIHLSPRESFYRQIHGLVDSAANLMIPRTIPLRNLQYTSVWNMLVASLIIDRDALHLQIQSVIGNYVISCGIFLIKQHNEQRFLGIVSCEHILICTFYRSTYILYTFSYLSFLTLLPLLLAFNDKLLYIVVSIKF